MRNKAFIAASLSTSLVLFLFLCLPSPTRAAEPVPGDACTTQYLIVTTGGPETTGVRNQMICNGSTWQQEITTDATGKTGIGTDSPAAKLHVGGEAIVGNTGLACGATVTGGLRYSSASSCIQLCDGTSWNCISTVSCDDSPAFFAFTDQTLLTTSTLVSSNIVLVTGMDAACAATVGVSGTGGSPEYRVCSTSNCSSVDINWTTANNSVAMQGKYLQLRATTSASAGTTFTITANVGPGSSDWDISTAYADCSANPIGTVCGDGSVYAGTSPDGSVPMFVQRCDAGQSWSGSACTGTRAGKAWNDGNANYVDTPLVNAASAAAAAPSGTSNTAILINADSNSVTAGTQIHEAAKYCADLSENGQTDWYMPSAPELNVMYSNRTAIANFDASPGNYWSSSEASSNAMWYQAFNTGGTGASYIKNTLSIMRCARRNADVTPTSLSFTDLTNQAAAALVTSNIVQITGIDTATSVGIIDKVSGAPQYRICSDSSCSSVVTGWNSSVSAISNNQYLQLRMYASGAASGVNSALVVVGVSTDQWDVTTSSSDPCAGSPSPGAVCTDGSVYAGISPDGSVAMYVQRCDVGQSWSGTACTGSRVGKVWNDGNTNWVDTTLANCGSAPGCNASGETNTTTLIAEDSSTAGGTQLHVAAQYCADLSENGQTDWYLPSAPELNVMYTNKTAIGQFEISGSSYWSSSEDTGDLAWYQRFSDGGQIFNYKSGGFLARCTRR